MRLSPISYRTQPANHAIAKAGGTPYIAFKDNTTAKGCGLFPRMWHLFSLNREAFLESYHKRSKVESTFSLIKAKFGDHGTGGRRAIER